MDKPKKAAWKRIFGCVGIVLLAIIVVVGGFLGWLTIREYRPADTEPLSIFGTGSETLHAGDTFTVMTWNIGYAALGDNADFFMDGGSMVQTADNERVNVNLGAIAEELLAVNPDIALLQEVDRNSSRSYGIDETVPLITTLSGHAATFAYNYKVPFVPYPVPPIGRVNSGLLTLSRYPVMQSDRVQLPCPFSWPIRLGNLKRCLMIDRIPVEGSDKELVVVCLHLEAYDDGEGKIAQTKMLREVLQEEAAAGNYVIAGGDFNQILSTIDNPFPSQEGMWLPGVLDVSAFSEGWQFEMDERLPSCRSLDQPLVGADMDSFQYYLIDGFIVSAGLEVLSCETQDLGFVNSDHNPVVMQVRLAD